MTFGTTLTFLLANFADEMVWCVVDEYHADYGPDVLNGPMTYAQAVAHKEDVQGRQPHRSSRIVFDFNQVSG